MAIEELREPYINRTLQTRLMEQLVTEIQGRDKVSQEPNGSFVCPYCWLDRPHGDDWHEQVKQTLMHAVTGEIVVSSVKTVEWAKRALEQLYRAPK